MEAIHAQEDRAAAWQNSEQVAVKLKEMKLADAAALVAAGIEETLLYYAFPREHWRCLRTNNPLETHSARSAAKNQSRGSISGWKIGAHAGRGPVAPRSRHEVGHATLPGHEPAGGSE